MDQGFSNHAVKGSTVKAWGGTDLIRLFNVALDMFCIIGYDGYFKQVSPAWERALGYTDTELLAKPYVEFIHHDDRASTLSATLQITQGIQVINFQNRYVAKDGAFHWLSWNSVPYPDEQLIYAVARDIADIKLREARQAAAYTVTRVLATARDLPIAAPEILRVVCERLD
jgi:PAS domain S-box-containing protein